MKAAIARLVFSVTAIFLSLREIEIVRVVEDGPRVFYSADQSLNDGAAQWVTRYMFDTDPEGLILEH